MISNHYADNKQKRKNSLRSLMAATVSLYLPYDLQNLHYQCLHSSNSLCKTYHTRPFTLFSRECKYPLLTLPKDRNFSFKTSSSSSSHSSPTSSYDEDPFQTGRFLSNEELEKLKFLANFRYLQELKSGSMWIRVMRADEIDATVGLLAESFAESMLLPSGYLSLLKFLVKQYLIERKRLMPHMATLIGFYRGIVESGEEEEVQLAGTVEISFNKRGANVSPPTPTPPKDSPYICNMAVKKSLRRRGIGWHLLKASEELISQMSSSREVYLHCRIIDEAPFNMYTKARYKVVKTDTILVFLTLQRRKYLMCKKLSLLSSPSESELSDSGMDKT